MWSAKMDFLTFLKSRLNYRPLSISQNFPDWFEPMPNIAPSGNMGPFPVIPHGILVNQKHGEAITIWEISAWVPFPHYETGIVPEISLFTHNMNPVSVSLVGSWSSVFRKSTGWYGGNQWMSVTSANLEGITKYPQSIRPIFQIFSLLYLSQWIHSSAVCPVTEG